LGPCTVPYLFSCQAEFSFVFFFNQALESQSLTKQGLGFLYTVDGNDKTRFDDDEYDVRSVLFF